MNTKYSLNTYLTILYFFFKKRYDNIIQHNLRTVSIKSMNQFNSNKNDVLDSYLGKNQDFIKKNNFQPAGKNRTYEAKYYAQKK